MISVDSRLISTVLGFRYQSQLLRIEEHDAHEGIETLADALYILVSTGVGAEADAERMQATNTCTSSHKMESYTQKYYLIKRSTAHRHLASYTVAPTTSAFLDRSAQHRVTMTNCLPVRILGGWSLSPLGQGFFHITEDLEQVAPFLVKVPLATTINVRIDRTQQGLELRFKGCQVVHVSFGFGGEAFPAAAVAVLEGLAAHGVELLVEGDEFGEDDDAVEEDVLDLAVDVHFRQMSQTREQMESTRRRLLWCLFEAGRVVAREEEPRDARGGIPISWVVDEHGGRHGGGVVQTEMTLVN